MSSGSALPPRGVRWIHRMEDALLALILSVMAVTAALQILVRNIFDFSLLWADPLIRLLVLWGGLLGALVATRERRHIRIEFMLHLCPARFRPLVDGVASLAAAAICALLSKVAVQFVLDERAFGGPQLLGLSSWQVQLVFPLVFCAMAGRFLLQAVQALRRR